MRNETTSQCNMLKENLQAESTDALCLERQLQVLRDPTLYIAARYFNIIIVKVPRYSHFQVFFLLGLSWSSFAGLTKNPQ